MMIRPEWYTSSSLYLDDHEATVMGALAAVRDRLVDMLGDSVALEVIDQIGAEMWAERARERADLRAEIERWEAERKASEAAAAEEERSMEPARRAAAEGRSQYERELAQTVSWGDE